MSAFKQSMAPRARAAALVLLLCAGAAQQAGAAEQRSALRGALDQQVEVHGALNYDSAGQGSGAMMYPAAGLAGMLVAIATHAAVSGAVREAEKRKLRDAADVILAPHKEVLKAFMYQDLMSNAAPLITEAGVLRVAQVNTEGAAGEVLIDSLPMYYLTQDRRAVILENAITIRRAGQAKPYEAVIRVVSAARDADGAEAFWFDQGADRLRDASARMLAQSVDIALKDNGADADAALAFKTVRYSEGGSERMERAQVVNTSCAHLVLRTLRGNLMVVPRKAGDQAADAACQALQAG